MTYLRVTRPVACGIVLFSLSGACRSEPPDSRNPPAPQQVEGVGVTHESENLASRLRALEMAQFAPADDGPVLDVGNQGIYCGFVHGDEYTLNCHNLAIEMLTGGKLNTLSRQRWTIRCIWSTSGMPSENAREFGMPARFCDVESTVFTEWSDIGPTVGQTTYSSVDGSLSVKEASFRQGRLLFDLRHDDGTTTSVSLRFTEKDGTLYLTELRGSGLSSGLLGAPVEAKEFRIAEYTYGVAVPILMKGFKSAGQKDFAEFLSTLSTEDQEAWRVLWADHSTWWDGPGSELEQGFAALDKEVEASGAKDMTPDQVRRVNELIAASVSTRLKKGLDQSKISADGRRRIYDHLHNALLARTLIGDPGKRDEQRP